MIAGKDPRFVCADWIERVFRGRWGLLREIDEFSHGLFEKSPSKKPIPDSIIVDGFGKGRMIRRKRTLNFSRIFVQ